MIDPNDRIPCPDGTCVGILDARGRCGTCGRQATEAEIAEAGGVPGADGVGEGSEIDHDHDHDHEHDHGEEEAAASDDGEEFDPGRELCPDGACIGVIGPDGRCKVCGLSADAPPPG